MRDTPRAAAISAGPLPSPYSLRTSSTGTEGFVRYYQEHTCLHSFPAGSERGPDSFLNLGRDARSAQGLAPGFPLSERRGDVAAMLSSTLGEVAQELGGLSMEFTFGASRGLGLACQRAISTSVVVMPPCCAAAALSGLPRKRVPPRLSRDSAGCDGREDDPNPTCLAMTMSESVASSSRTRASCSRL
jgi:hypothetical protein